MSASDLEERVLAFLERREHERDLDPERYANECSPGDERLLGALRAALAAESQLRQGASAPGERIGPYRILRTLGAGGMGVVHEVERGGQHFALKRLHGVVGPRARERFRREARLLERLNHPGIVRVVELLELEGELNLVLELVQGGPLSEAAAGLDLQAKLGLALELADAVQAIHDAGLLHRDLKPQNVLVRADGRAVLVDFGLGAANDDAALTSTGDLLGTPRYMSPEQARGEPADLRTDVWGLGQVLFELFTGEPAVAEGSREQVLSAVMQGRLRRARRIAPLLPASLARVLEVALARLPSRRYQTARALAEDLQRVKRGEQPTARPPGPLARRIDDVRLQPARALALGLFAAVLAALPVAVLLERQSEARERGEVSRRHLERALVAWTMGEQESAARSLGMAIHGVAGLRGRALAEVLAGRKPSEAGEWGVALTALAGGEAGVAAEHFAQAEPRDAAALALEARALRLAGDEVGASAILDELERRAPGSSLSALERAALLDIGGAREAALGVLRLAVEHDPEDPWLGRAFADALATAGFQREALEVACAAARALERLGDAGPDELSRWLRQWPQRERVRSELRRRAETDPHDADCAFALAALFDADHLVEEAARSYEELLARDGEHAWAMAYLANLRAGADRGRCAECDSAFAREPGLIDASEAEWRLAGAVRADRGRDPDLLRTIVQVARDHALASAACAALDEALEGDLPPAQRSRLAEARGVLGREIAR